MAKMPDETALGRRPIPQGSGGLARYQVGGQPEAVGQATARLAGRMQSGVAKMDQALQIEAERVDTLRAEEAYTKAVAERMRLTYDQDAGFMNIKGEAAVTKPLVQDYVKQYDQFAERTAATLGNENQREKFKKRFEIARLQMAEDGLRHTAQQRQVYADQVYEGTMAVQTQAAAVAWDSPNDVLLAATHIRNAIADRAEDQDWPAQHMEQEVLARMSGVHEAVIRQALTAGRNKYAEDWFTRFQQEIDQNTAMTLALAVAGGERKDQFNSYTHRFILSKTLDSLDAQQLAMHALQNEVMSDQIIDDTQRNTLLGQIVSRLESLNKQAQARYDASMNGLTNAIESVNKATEKGYPAAAADLMEIVEASKGTPAEREAMRMVHLANAVRDFVDQHPAAQAGSIIAYRRHLDANPNEGDIKVLESMERIHKETKAELQDNPAGYGIGRGLTQPVQLNLAEPETQQAEFNQVFVNAQMLRDRHGAAYKPLTEDNAAMLTQLLTDADWQSQAEYLGKLWIGSAGNTKGYNGMMDQIAENQPVIAMAGERVGMNDKATADLMLRGQSYLQPKNAGTPPGGSLVWMPPQNEMLAAFTEYVDTAYAGNPEEANAVYQAARAIYAAMTADAGAKDSESLDTDRWDRAMALATGGRPDGATGVDGGIEEYHGAKLPLPPGMTKSEFRDQLAVHADYIANLPGMNPSVTRAAIMDAQLVPGVRAGTYMIRNGNDLLYRVEPDDARRGELGVLRGQDGRNMTEYSVTVKDGSRYVNIPTLVKGQVDVESILAGKKPTQQQVEIALRRAKERQQAGATLPTYQTEPEALRAAETRTEQEKMIQGGPRPVPIVIDMNNPPPSGRTSSGRVRGVSEMTAAEEQDYWDTQGTRAPPTTGVPRPPEDLRRRPVSASAESSQKGVPAEPKQEKPFTPAGKGYDYDSARKSGATADENGHWPMLAPLAPQDAHDLELPVGAALILKGRQHPTWDVGVAAEYIAGNAVIKKGDRYYSVPIDWLDAPSTARVRRITPNLRSLPSDVFQRYQEAIEQQADKLPKGDAP